MLEAHKLLGRMDIIAVVLLKKIVKRNAEIIGYLLKNDNVGDRFPRFPYLKILVMYECLRLFEKALISLFLINFAD